MHTSRDRLVPGAEAIRRAADFTDKWGKTFADMRDFAATVNSLDYYLPSGGACKAFLADWNAAHEAATITAEDVWKNLQNGKAAAEVELDSHKAKWRGGAREVLQKAIDQVPRDLQAAGILDGEFSATLTATLQREIERLASEASIGRAPLLVAIAEGKVKEVASAIQNRKAELARAAAAVGSPSTPTGGNSRRVRLADLGRRTVIASIGEWEEVDANVRRELTAGNEVELG
jgi:post-segregation antitoxin (ccd killing protein)